MNTNMHHNLRRTAATIEGMMSGQNAPVAVVDGRVCPDAVEFVLAPHPNTALSARTDDEIALAEAWLEVERDELLLAIGRAVGNANVTLARQGDQYVLRIAREVRPPVYAWTLKVLEVEA